MTIKITNSFFDFAKNPFLRLNLGGGGRKG
jgi:hypothetical protein